MPYDSVSSDVAVSLCRCVTVDCGVWSRDFTNCFVMVPLAEWFTFYLYSYLAGLSVIPFSLLYPSIFSPFPGHFPV